MSIIDLKSLAQLKSLQAALPASKRVCVLYFFAQWEASSVEGIEVLDAIVGLYGESVLVAKVNTEGDDALSLTTKFQVDHVPTVVCLIGDNVVEKVVGYVPSAIQESVVKAIATASSGSGASGDAAVTTEPAAIAAASAAAAASTVASSTEVADSKENAEKRLRDLVSSSPIMLFMKGSPSAPRCGFSRQAIALLQSQMELASQKLNLSESEVSFGSFDILSDNEVREGLKKLFNWPTYPQLYVNGELVGGLDVMKELAEDESLVDSIVEAFSS